MFTVFRWQDREKRSIEITLITLISIEAIQLTVITPTAIIIIQTASMQQVQLCLVPPQMVIYYLLKTF